MTILPILTHVIWIYFVLFSHVPSLRSGSHSGGFPEGAERERAPGVPGGARPAEGAAGRLQGCGQHEGEQQTKAGGPQGGSHKGEGVMVKQCFMENTTEGRRESLIHTVFSQSKWAEISVSMSINVVMLYVDTHLDKGKECMVMPQGDLLWNIFCDDVNRVILIINSWIKLLLLFIMIWWFQLID